MKDILLIIAVLGVFVLGFFLIKGLDRFLNENKHAIENEKEKKEPSLVMLTDELPDDEIIQEVKRFRLKHKDTKILIYDASNADFPEDFDRKIEE